MPPRPTGGPGRNSSVSPVRSRSPTKAPPRKREPRVDPKELAEKAEKERQIAREVLRRHVDEVLTRATDKNDDQIEISFIELVEQACQEVFAWLKSPIGDSALQDEFALQSLKVDKAFAKAVELTREKRAEPPLPLNIFSGSQIIVTGEGRQLEAAVKEGDEVEVRRLLQTQRGRALLNTVDSRGWAPIHYAVCQAHEAIATELINAGADVNSQAMDGTSPLHLACSEGRSHMMQVLFKAGAVTDPETKDTRWTPLHTAASNGCMKAVRNLLEAKANANASATGDWRPLHCAAMNGHADVATLLMMPKGRGEIPADSNMGLELLTGDGTIKVRGLTPAEVARAHGFEDAQEEILATALRIKQAAELEAQRAEAAAAAVKDAKTKNKKGVQGRGSKGRSVSPTKTGAASK